VPRSWFGLIADEAENSFLKTVVQVVAMSGVSTEALICTASVYYGFPTELVQVESAYFPLA
jgi:hypothetical protein